MLTEISGWTIYQIHICLLWGSSIFVAISHFVLKYSAQGYHHYTDRCSDCVLADQERLQRTYGAAFFTGYILVFMLVSALFPTDFRCARCIKMPKSHRSFSAAKQINSSRKTSVEKRTTEGFPFRFVPINNKNKQLEGFPLKHKKSKTWSTTPPEHLVVAEKRTINLTSIQIPNTTERAVWSRGGYFSHQQTKPAKKTQPLLHIPFRERIHIPPGGKGISYSKVNW